MILDELAVRYGTDKGSGGHFYTRHYDRILGPNRMNVESMCEVGVATGASLRMWRDYFQSAMIYGIDQNDCGNLGERILTYACEQTDKSELVSKLQDKHLEIIIDDASHDERLTLETLTLLWPILEPQGWYVIEDMMRDSFPELIGRWYGQRPHEIRQLQILNNLDRSSSIIFIQKQ